MWDILTDIPRGLFHVTVTRAFNDFGVTVTQEKAACGDAFRSVQPFF